MVGLRVQCSAAADGTGDGGRRRVASEPVELPGSGSGARPWQRAIDKSRRR